MGWQVSTLRKKARAHMRITAIFLVVAGGFLFALYRSRMVHQGEEGELSALDTLPQIYRAEGLESFLAKKRALRASVSKQIGRANENADASLKATRIAVYLFPEVLSSNDFEKTTAQETFAPLEAAIEREPKSPKSRELFEELRADIWNYESIRRDVPYVSDDAAKVIRIYDVLTTQ
jgi:hypothetical protein